MKNHKHIIQIMKFEKRNYEVYVIEYKLKYFFDLVKLKQTGAGCRVNF